MKFFIFQNGDITKGSITVDGEDITNAKPSKIVEKGIAQVLEGRRIFSELTVIENLRLGGHTKSKDVPQNIDRVLDLFPILKERSKGEAGYLSGGEQQMLAIGRALMTNPKLLILDEATEGLAPMVRQEIWACIERLKKEGIAILIIDKNIRDLTRISDKHFIIENPQTGLLKEQWFMYGMPYIDIDYCKYGMPYRKRTRLWNNVFNWKPRPLCKKDCNSMVGNKHKAEAVSYTHLTLPTKA